MSLLDRGIRGNVPSPLSTEDAGTVAYSNPRMPTAWNGNVELALDYLFDALYPNYKGTVATPADLPMSGNQVNDYYLVTDEGDGKSAGYVWTTVSGVTAWIKRYSVDWSYEAILADTVNRTSYMYAAKYGVTDKDSGGAEITGLFAGQHIYGGDKTLQNLTLTANVIDSTGYVQVENTFRPTVANTLDLGDSTYKWRTLYIGTSIIIGTTTYSSAGLTDSGGTFTFTTTNISAPQALFGTTLTLATGSISDSGGALSFGSNNLTTTGTITGASSSKLADITFTNGTFNTLSSAFSFSSKDVGGIGTLSATTVAATTLTAGSLVLAGQTVKTNLDATNLILQAGTGGANTKIVEINSKLQADYDISVSGQVTASGTGTHSFAGTTTFGSALSLSNASSNGRVASSVGDLQFVPSSGIVSVTGKILPEANGTRDLGSTALRFQNLYLSGSLGDGTNLIGLSTLLTLRNMNTGVSDGMALFYDAASGTWKPSIPDLEINHSTLAGLTTGDAGHTQFAMLAGRSGGQSINGGTAASENLTLDSTANSTKGKILLKSDIAPNADAVYSGGWSGINLGGASNNFNNLYMKGVAYGLRIDQYANGSFPASSGQNTGRIIFDTTYNQLNVDNGSSWSAIGTQKYLSDTSWDGSTTSKTVTVSGSISDARTAIWQLLDNTNSFKRVFCEITMSQTQVTITCAPALPAGSYRLIGLN